MFAQAVQAGDWPVAGCAIGALLAADPGNSSPHCNRRLVWRRMARIFDAASAFDATLSPAPGLPCCGVEAAHSGSGRPDAPGRGDLNR